MGMRGGLAVVLFYLASLNALLAAHVGTCNQGDASRLWGGAVSLLLYVWAAWLVARMARVGLAGLLLLPVVPALFWTTKLGARLLLASSHGASACSVLEGASYPVDGNEAAYAAIWLLLSCAGWLGLGLTLLRYWKARSAKS
jgi:hypothetical protein